MAKPNLAII